MRLIKRKGSVGETKDNVAVVTPLLTGSTEDGTRTRSWRWLLTDGGAGASCCLLAARLLLDLFKGEHDDVGRRDSRSVVLTLLGTKFMS